MEQLRSLEEFDALQQQLFSTIMPEVPTIVIPAGTCGKASGAEKLIRTAQREILEKNLQDKICLKITGCHGFCEMEPSVLIEPQRTFYPNLDSGGMQRVIDALVKGEVVEDLLYLDEATGLRIEKQDDIPFFRHQSRLLLSRNEKIDPLDIYDCLRNGGYSAFADVLRNISAEEVIDEVKKSGLRGRGGAGFPTGMKWGFLAGAANGKGKYIVCNADEGDPGAYMDRSLLEGNPHSIIEGMLIGAYATGADSGVMYVRSEYPLAIKHLNNALAQVRNTGLLGKNILGTGFSFDISMVKGAGAFVCGEETALMRSIEGKMGEPCQRPPFPIEKGIHGKPTMINNVETWANIPGIIKNGAEEYAAIGSMDAGTKIFSLVGKIKNTGLVEVPMGTPIKQVLYDIGGGQAGKTGIKAVQTGGPSGGCIPAHLFDMPISYGSLAAAGSIIGSGGMIVMDENTCMIDVAKYFMHFLKDESCGKCFSCRKGTQRMYELLDDISSGRGTMEHLDLMEELAVVMKDTAMCGLGQTAPNPVLSTLRYFRDEYIEHIQNKRCPAGVCKALISFSINENCTGCGACARVCPEQAIKGEKKQRHVIDPDCCNKCGACRSICKFDAIDVK
ncbi:MAG: NADH-ubiquinone oxidoreductase-F iron-sulfur binding region domain-containing protein [Desulfobacterales bacterium]|nr:NADH-ubiquinone oxidoreductase-F iron-sulfur binding region domain-containing protein [Desulfobacterales bacterium]MDD4073050.1 NADH-ubiquinone oxidoreductase-F iron-sulfur binding region domain-containing protein [Desulfobacterales bacterium]MDD4393466.1 NADH-ubiquinone oxidoreductase-F iron-sulfur binding region domain-containing protein [Desulfobacterales bacterium]